MTAIPLTGEGRPVTLTAPGRDTRVTATADRAPVTLTAVHTDHRRVTPTHRSRGHLTAVTGQGDRTGLTALPTNAGHPVTTASLTARAKGD